MKHVIVIFIFSACFFTEASFVFAQDVSISIEEQKKRDSDKEQILRAELTQEMNFIGEKTQLAAIADAMQDREGAYALRSEIVQHQLNIALLKKELEPRQGGGTKTTARRSRTTKAISEQAENENSDWWNPYTRKPSISMY